MSCDLQGIQRGYSYQMHNAARNQRRLRRGMLFSMRIKPFNMRGLGYFKKSRLCLARYVGHSCYLGSRHLIENYLFVKNRLQSRIACLAFNFGTAWFGLPVEADKNSHCWQP